MDTEKLKTLALAYLDANRGYWYGAHELADGTTYEPGVDFIVECNPATVLALIAEVERLRADAERYRWLTEDPGYNRPHLNGKAVYVNWFGTKQALDAAVDAALEKEKA